jgi:hypothetical protein
VRIIVPLLAGGLAWWLIWMAFTNPNTWPYLAAYLVAGLFLMFVWGWLEERLGYEAARRPDEEQGEITARVRAETTLADFRAKTGQTYDDLQPGLHGALYIRPLEARRKETVPSAHPTARVPSEHV